MTESNKQRMSQIETLKFKSGTYKKKKKKFFSFCCIILFRAVINTFFPAC